MGKGLIGCLVVVLIAALFLGMWLMGQYNSLVQLNESVDSAWAEIDNQLKRRADLIPNLVETVKGYAQQEQTVFIEIAEARSRLAGATTPEEAANANAGLTSALGRLLAIAEAYPELKSNTNFLQLQDELAGTENRIQVARKRYNDLVRDFNARIKQFPTALIAGFLGFQPRQYFEIGEAERQVPKVDFSPATAN